MIGGMRYAAIVAACLLSFACSTAPATIQPAHETTRPASAFIGKVWISTDASAAHGTLRIFLPDGTLVMDSCSETYRLARWKATGEHKLEWEEDTARIEAEIIDLPDEHLRLRLRLAGGFKDETYRLAQVPFVCPDTPR
jgi:hypothetical protein